MRAYIWLILGLIINHESLTPFKQNPDWRLVLSQFIINPSLFLHTTIMMLIGLVICAYSFNYGFLLNFHREAKSHNKVIYGMIYLITLIGGWAWLVAAFPLGGVLTIVFTIIYLFLVIKN